MRAHKIAETRQYTEVIYYDDDGVEVGRVTLGDDHAYDAKRPVELDEDERGDWL